MTFKRISVSLCTIIICMMIFLCGYSKTAALNSYADSTIDNWQNVTTNAQLVEAFRYYCKSRDLTIEGSIADGVTSFTTKTFNGLCNTLGIDVTALQAHLKYETDSNLGTRFLFDSVGISAYNQIFAQFLQDNDLDVGDSVNKIVYSGKYFTDEDGISCLVFIDNGTVISSIPYGSAVLPSDFIFGTPYIYNSEQIRNRVSSSSISNPFVAHVTSSITYTYNVKYYNWVSSGNTSVRISDGNSRGSYNIIYYETYNDVVNTEGYPAIIFNSLNGNLYYGGYYNNTMNNRHYLSYLGVINSDATGTQPCNIYITTNNTNINNNTYEGDTIINNNGTTGGDDNPDPDPGYNPYPGGGGTTTDPDNTGGGSGDDDTTITFPDFDFHFPEIDWSLGDLSQKFPFSIPFDLIAFFTVLNAEPQAPAIDANIPLGSWYTWHFEADFSQFDNYAVIVRNVEFIGFCVALIYLTIRLVKG